MRVGEDHVTSLGHQTTGLADLVLHVPWIQEEVQRLKDRQTTQESDLSTAREAWPQLSHQLVDLREEVTYLRRKELGKIEAVLQSLAPVEALQEFGRGFSTLDVRVQQAEASLENMSRKMQVASSEAKDESQQALRTLETRLQQAESALEGISGQIHELQTQSQPKDVPTGRAESQTAAGEGATEASELALSRLQDRIDKAEASLENISRKMQVAGSEAKDESQQALRTLETRLQQAESALEGISGQIHELQTQSQPKDVPTGRAESQTAAGEGATEASELALSRLQDRIDKAEASLENMSRKMQVAGSEAKDESQQALRTLETRLQQAESALEGISGQIHELQTQSQPKDVPTGRAESQTAAGEGATEASELALSRLQDRIDKAEASLENMSRKMQVAGSEAKDESQQALRTLETRLQQAESALETISKRMPQGEDIKSALSPNAPKAIEWFAPEPELNVRLRHLERRLGEEASNIICLSQKLDQVRSTALISEERISALCTQAKAALDSARNSSEA